MVEEKISLKRKILMKVKSVLAALCPITIRRFNYGVSETQKLIKKEFRENSKQISALKKENQKQFADLKKEIQRLAKEGEEQRQQNKELQKMLFSNQKTLLSYYETMVSDQHALLETMNSGQQTLLEKCSLEEEALNNISQEVKNSTRAAMEGVWADVFNNTINNSSWLLDQTFSPGRWAVGYQCLYAMYRILDEAKPKRILELGLGQSTRMISQYAATHEGVEHVVVENDANWVEFFKNAYDVPECSRIEVCEHEMISYNEADEVRVYKDFAEKVKDMQFDFIIIDAPKSGDMKRYARIDVLRMMPGCLSENFVILMDDYNRDTELRTVREMEKVLKENEIPYKRGKYSGLKDCGILCAEHLGFLATL